MDIKKRFVIFSLLFIILFLGTFFVKAAVNVDHSTSEFKIKIDGVDRTLQYAITYNLLRGLHTYSIPPIILGPGHGPDEIWVSTDTGEKNLDDALSTLGELCKSSPTTSYSGPTNPSDLSKAYHYASEIEVSLGTSFQDAVDSGQFCCTFQTCASLGKACGTWSDGCGGTLYCTTSHASSSCYNNDVYWYNSCGTRQEKKQECGTSYCGSWSSWYRYSGCTYKKDRTCYNKGCSGGSCYNNAYTESKTDKCPNGGICTDGVCRQGKVICTELYNTGYLDEETYKMDLRYAAKHLSPEAIRGYQAWGIPVVKAMRKNPEESKRFVIPLVYSFVEEVAYRMGEREIGNEVGHLFLDMGVPLFERIGVHINELDWRSLFDESWLKEEVDPIYLSIIKFAITDNPLSAINIIRNILENNNEEKKYDDLVKDYFTEDKIKEMYYDAKEKSEGSDMKFARALLENLEEAVEEIEAMVKSMQDI